MQKKLRTLAKKVGVKFVDIETVYLSKDTKFGKNVIIEPYVVIGLNETKRKYLETLRKCCVGVNGEQTYGGWSIATTDGNMCGVPYIQYDADYYRELNGGSDFYKGKDELIQLLNEYLDKPSYRNQMAKQTIENLILKVNLEKKIKSVSKKIKIFL